MNRMFVAVAAAAALAMGRAEAQEAGPAAPRGPVAEPAPAPDGSRVWHGTIVYRVRMAQDTTGADTASWTVQGAQLVARDRMAFMGMTADVESRMALPSLAPAAAAEMREGRGMRMESRITYANGRAMGTVTLPGSGASPIDAEMPAGTYDMGSLASVIAALPLRAGAVWTLPVYAPYVRRVLPMTVEVGAAEAVETAMGPVRAFRVRVTGGRTEMLYWFSEAEPRWEVRGEVPAMGVVIEARSRTP